MKNIIFDLGNVLYKFYPQEYLSQIYDQKTYEDLMIIIFCSNEWDDLDEGKITINEAIDILTKANPQYAKELTQVLSSWSDMLEPINENVTVLRQLYEMGYPLYILSNFHIEAYERVCRENEFMSYFKGGIISAKEHVLKPSLEIFHLLLDRYHLKAEECLFIDDSYANIMAARELGMDGIQLNYGVNLMEKLKERKII